MLEGNIMNIKSALLLLLISFTAFGCSDKEDADAAKMETLETTKISGAKIKGYVRGKKFEIDEAVIENGKLTLRQGSGFFADKSVTVTTFETGSLEEKVFQETVNEGGSGNPHINLAVKKEGGNLPDSQVIMRGYDLNLVFGKATDAGIPFAIKLVVPGKEETKIEGSFVATYKKSKQKG